MKPMLYVAIITVLCIGLLAAVLLPGCKKRPNTTDDIDGGVRHYVDENAPKVIESTQIVSFECYFSTLDLSIGDTALAGRVYTLKAAQNGGSYATRAGGEVYDDLTFTPDPHFFEQLQHIVSQYDFAQYNGQHYTASGLPPDFGAKLTVEYASGEYICASDNQNCFIPLDAMQALVELFREACASNQNL